MLGIKILKCSLEAPKFVEFYEKWKSDILTFHPDFELEGADLSALFTLGVENLIVGVFIYQTKGDEIHIDVDYVVPAFRDKGIAQHFFNEKLDTFKKDSFKVVYAIGSNTLHANYLIQHKFKLSQDHPELYFLTL